MTPIGSHLVTLLENGAQTFPAMLSAIQHAQKTVCLQTYILRDDETGQRFAKALAKKAREGVEVSLMFDAWGSDVRPHFLEQLRAAGVKVQPFGKVIFQGRLRQIFRQLRRRNHRKMLMVDGRIGFTGGLNLSNDYAALADAGQGFRDTHVQVEGPAVLELQQQFLETWRQAKGPPLTWGLYQGTELLKKEAVQFLSNRFGRNQKDIYAMYLGAIARAQHRLYLTHAYFVPPLRLRKALAKAARRGVDVQVIVAAHTDVPITYYASISLYGQLLRAGVRIFEWKGPVVLHAKTAVVDGEFSTVGSANLDTLSLQANLENNVVIEDKTFGAHMEELFVRDLAFCEEVTWQQWKTRPLWQAALSHLAYQFRKWL